MKINKLFYIIYFLCIIAVYVGVYFDLGIRFMSVPYLVVLIVTFSDVYTKSKGTWKNKLARVITAFIVFCLILGSFSWILISTVQDYYGESFFDAFYRMTGMIKVIVFIGYFSFSYLLWLYIIKIADSLINGLASIYYSSSKSKRDNIIYFLVLYFSTIILFAVVYDISYKVNPEAYRIATENNPKFLDFLYFSFVTSTSYGTDLISPISGFIRTLIVIQLMISLIILMIYVSHVMSLPNSNGS